MYVPQLTRLNYRKSIDCTENVRASMTTLDNFHDEEFSLIKYITDLPTSIQ